MWKLWSFLDKIIIFPAFIAGYIFNAYRTAFNYGKTKYLSDLTKSVGEE